MKPLKAVKYMKIKDGFIIRKIADQYMAVPVGARAKELHGMIGLYRLAVKWDVMAGNRAALRKVMYFLIVAMIACGSLTAWTYYSNGKALVESGEPIVKYEPVNNWWK